MIDFFKVGVVLFLFIISSNVILLIKEIHNYNNTVEQMLKNKQPEQLRLIEEQYILAEE